MINSNYTQTSYNKTSLVNQKSKMTTQKINSIVVEMSSNSYYDDIVLLQEFALEEEYYGDYYISDAEYEKIEAFERKEEEEMLKNIQTEGFIDFGNNCDVFDICPGSGYCDF